MNIKYKCACMKAAVEISVPDRRKGADLDGWMHAVLTCVSMDHRALNVLCQRDKMDELFIPYEPDSNLGLGEAPVKN